MLKLFKRRYLALQMDMDFAPNEREFMDAVWGAVTRLFGEYGASLANLVLINYDCESKRAIIRTNLDTLNNVRAALATITSVGGKNAAFHVLAVSGTIKALSENLES